MASFLYHITYDRNLFGIAGRGLVPGQQSAIGGAQYTGHREGAIFLTKAAGIHYWYDRAEEWGRDQGDPLEWTPVVLRVQAPLCEIDKLGTADSGSAAFRCMVAIPPAHIQVWAGDVWLPIEGWEHLDPEKAFEDGYMLDSWSNPLVPQGDELALPEKQRASNPTADPGLMGRLRF